MKNDPRDPPTPSGRRLEHDAERDLVRELEAERARSQRLEREVARLRQRTEELRSKLDDVYQGETFRLGRALLRFPRWVKKRLGWREEVVASPRKTGVQPRVTPVERHGPLASFEVTVDASMREDYLRLCQKDLTGAQVRRAGLVFGVSTTDLSAGRGDLFAAVGLGRYLERLGFDVAILGPEDWTDVPDGVDVFVAMVAEPDLEVDPLALPDGCCAVAWIRNSTERWASLATLPLYDAVLCSSERSAQYVRRAFNGPVSVLPLAVDHELFSSSEGDRQGVVATVNQWTYEKPRAIYRLLAQIDLEDPLGLYGVQRGLNEELEPYRNGLLSFFELPSLYRQAAYVLDDQQPVNRRFGNVNSRVYESLACGALPVTAAPAGLGEVGLGEVPTVMQPRDLGNAVRMGEGARQRLASRLRHTVLERHTFETRASTFRDFLGEHHLGRADRPARPVTVLGFQPDYRATNPYQSMLYAGLRRREETAVVPVDDLGSFVRSSHQRGFRPIAHVHWTAPILGPARSERDARSRLDRYIDALDQLVHVGGSLVWTVHNAMPHECAFPDVEVALRRELARRADAIHVMCSKTPRIVAQYGYQLPEDRLYVIPHGSYVDVYPNLVSKEDARGELGLDKDVFVYLFLGQIRPYKGIERLLDAFERVHRGDPGSRLLIAGSPGRFRGVRELEKRAGRQEGVDPHFTEIPATELQVFLNACDVFVLPHERVLNSGGIQLAFTYGRPVLAPNTGCISGSVPAELGVLFDDELVLEEAMTRVRNLTSEATARAAFDHALAYTYLDMAEDFDQLIARIASTAQKDELPDRTG